MNAGQIDFSNIPSMKNTGADLTQYSLELQRERNTRSLTLRRSNRPSIAGLMNRCSKVTLIDPTKYPFLNPDVAIQIVVSKNAQKIFEFSSNILTTSAASPKLLSALTNSKDFCDALCNAFQEIEEQQTLINLMNIIATIFPLSDNMKESYIDGGIICSIMDYLQSDSQLLACNSILLIKALCDSSVYARDSVLTFGVHTMLMELASTTENEEIVVDACRTIASVFEKKEIIESTIITESVEQLAKLLALPYPQAVCAILNTFVSIIAHLPTIILDIFDSGVVPSIIHMLEIPELAAAALPLIGNLSAAHPTHIQKMFDIGLIDKLTPLTATNMAGDVFFVFSNLITCVPSLIIPMFDYNFIESAIEIAHTASFDVKKEVVFFLTTLIIHTSTDEMRAFVRTDIIDLIIEMLGCGVPATVLSCLEVIQRFALAVSAGGAESTLISAEQWEDLSDALTALSERGPPSVKEKASFIMEKINSVVSE
jgi:hypothetical protein